MPQISPAERLIDDRTSTQPHCSTLVTGGWDGYDAHRSALGNEAGSHMTQWSLRFMSCFLQAILFLPAHMFNIFNHD